MDGLGADANIPLIGAADFVAQLKVRRHTAVGRPQQHPRAGTIRSDGVNPVRQPRGLCSSSAIHLRAVGR
jgi:hypothetical protein